MKFNSIAYRIRNNRSAGRIREVAGKPGRMDIFIFMVTIILSVLGILMVYESSAVIALRDFGDHMHFVTEQSRWMIVGMVSMTVLSRVHPLVWEKYARHIFIVMIFLLVVVLVPGIGLKIMGARRWIDLGIGVLQPSEFAKLAMVIYLSAWLSHEKRKPELYQFLMLMTVVLGLLVVEPDMGTSIVLGATMLSMYFVSGAPLWHFGVIIPVFAAAGLGLAVIAPYRFSRLMTFMNIDHDPLGASYQVRQILFALSQGGLMGRGIGGSRQKYAYLPEANTDSIFAIIAEEFGFLGSVLFISLILFLVWRGMRIVRSLKSPFARLLATGISLLIGIQSVINLGAMVALFPLTGITLPLISYGGSSLTVTLSGIGILLSLSRYRKLL